MRTSKLSGVYPAFLDNHDEKPDQATSSIPNSYDKNIIFVQWSNHLNLERDYEEDHELDF
jgi:hypothetical protein